MPVKVYIWQPDESRRIVGHATLLLSNGVYINCCSPSSSSLEKDIEAEGCDPNITLIIDKDLDEGRMELFWEEWARQRRHWSGISYSCCEGAYATLREGGAPPSMTIYWRPDTLRRYVVRFLKDWTGVGTLLNLPWVD